MQIFGEKEAQKYMKRKLYLFCISFASEDDFKTLENTSKSKPHITSMVQR